MRYHGAKRIFGSIMLVAAIVGTAFFALPADAATVQELEGQITAKEEAIKKLEVALAQYQKNLTSTKSEGVTLKKTVDRLNKEITSLRNSVALTERKVEKKKLEINKLSLEIIAKEKELHTVRSVISEILFRIFEKDREPVLYSLLRERQISGAFGYMNQLASLDSALKESHDALEARKAELENLRGAAEKERGTLENLQEQYADKKNIQEGVKSQKEKLLTQTKSKESEYQKLIKATEEKKLAIEREIDEAEEALRRFIDPSRLPRARQGVLLWPLNGGRITQGYGVTSFSSRNPIYNHSGGFHNGIDIGVPIGTEVYAGESGEVFGAGDSDKYCPGLAYGKWLLIKHDNNLATLYVHLSQVRVSVGTRVERGDHVAYSGNTGRSTGPHLHFTVYDANTIQIYQSAFCGPVPRGGSLNPLDYVAKP
ncbi:MAG: peptidoglycan DD-metalloendopeptidase family protein [bacterium]|nr:peptidoglycan DD-metalloendopeptidase family protein [bacterium]